MLLVFIMVFCTPWIVEQGINCHYFRWTNAFSIFVAYGSDGCTDGFPSLHQILTTNETVLSPPPRLVLINQRLVSVQQGIFPSLRITCNGTLTRLIYSTSRTSEQPNQLANEFYDFWRKNDTDPDTANLVLPPPRRSNEVFVRNISNDTALYSLDVNVSVQVNDFFGFASFERTLLRFQLLDEGSEPVSLFRVPGVVVDLKHEVPDGVYLPLITAVISRECLFVGLLSTAEHAACREWNLIVTLTA